MPGARCSVLGARARLGLASEPPRPGRWDGNGAGDGCGLLGAAASRGSSRGWGCRGAPEGSGLGPRWCWRRRTRPPPGRIGAGLPSCGRAAAGKAKGDVDGALSGSQSPARAFGTRLWRNLPHKFSVIRREMKKRAWE